MADHYPAFFPFLMGRNVRNGHGNLLIQCPMRTMAQSLRSRPHPARVGEEGWWKPKGPKGGWTSSADPCGLGRYHARDAVGPAQDLRGMAYRLGRP